MKQEQPLAGDNLQQLKEQKQQKYIEHPQVFYSINEVYSIRKDSINNSNDHIYKRLSRQFQRIKKIKSEPNSQAILNAQYDYDNCPFRRELRKVHELYNQSSKCQQVVKRRIDKMRNKVDRIKGEVEKDELNIVKEIDPFKIVGKTQNQNNLSSSASVPSIAKTKS